MSPSPREVWKPSKDAKTEHETQLFPTLRRTRRVSLFVPFHPAGGGNFHFMSNETERRAPAFQFYADDFLAGTMTMTNEERGAYITLLCLQWSKGFISSHDCDRITVGMPPHSQAICRAKFQADANGNLRNSRLEAERAKQSAHRVKQSENARKRWSGNAAAHPAAMPPHMPEQCSPSPSPISTERDSSAPVRDGSWPKLDDVLTAASMRAIPASVAEAFWNHFEAQGWQTKDGLPIVAWQPKLASWWVNEQTRTAKVRQTGSGGYSGRRAPLPVTPDDAGF